MAPPACRSPSSTPPQVRAFGKALGQRAKTDPIDARLIARFATTTRPEARPLPDAATVRLADLVSRRRQIIAMMVAERQRQRRFTERRLQQSITRLLDALQRKLSEVEAEIDSDVRGSPAWREKEDLLASVPGVGPTIAHTRRGPCPQPRSMPELGTLDRRQIAALAGLVPWTRQSGQWKGRTVRSSASDRRRPRLGPGGAAHGHGHGLPDLNGL